MSGKTERGCQRRLRLRFLSVGQGSARRKGGAKRWPLAADSQSRPGRRSMRLLLPASVRLESWLRKVLGLIMSKCSLTPWLFIWLMLLYQSGCYFLDSVIAASSFRHVHHYINKSNLDQGYCERKRKLSNFSGWRLSTEKLTATLPIDRIEENYVREVQGSIFSVAYPTPFKSRVLLVAFSKFGSWAGQLGDGRAHLIGVYTNRFGDTWELQLKGSGRTPYSRNGDGRAVLRSSVREFLGSEAMHYLGIPTSRAASLVLSDDDVWRDRFYNGDIKKERGAIVLRVAKSWFRIGSLEILTRSGELDLLRVLLDLVIDEHFPSISMNDSNKYLAFFSRVVSETADLIALWMSVGFAHGVCNTDNFSLLSITIDYGPFGFMDSYDPGFVPNISDDERRYNIGNQANVGMFNLNKLLQALNPLLDPRQKQLASQILEGYPDQYYKRFTELFKAKLGLLGSGSDDGYLIAFLLKLMEDVKADFTMTFRQLGEMSLDHLKDVSIPQEFWAIHDIAKHELFSSWVAMYLLRLQRNADDSESDRKRRMASVNPRYVLRNWMAESAIQKAERNDFSEVRLLLQVLQHPFQVQTVAETAGYAQRPPAWAKEIKVSCSS
ncbi:protein adenylyltransferase SelO-like isoform X2 [Eublepharis macularius]|uniref:Selenoprotein O n=1 Tax=Eublepharis macularius TaxID=481883 RepID=A0AA97L8N3_EUBMA|nr:protein adenylyltransferase SelO-like isoform X2 [Eublepharis macularius]